MYRSPGTPDNILVTCQILSLISEFRTKKYSARVQSPWPAESHINWTAFGLIAEDAPKALVDLNLHTMHLPEAGNFCTLPSVRTITCCYCSCCDDSWEITFVSSTGFWVIYWGLPNSREVIFYSAFKESSSRNTSKSIIVSTYMKRNTWIFSQFKLHLWI